MDPLPLSRVTAILGFTTALYTSGIYFSQSQLTLPILYRFPAAVSASIFEELYYRGAVVIGPSIAVSTIFSGTAAYLDPPRRIPYAIAAVATIATLVHTRVVMQGTINKLIEVSQNETVREKIAQGDVVAMLKSWKFHNMIRVVYSAAGGIIGLLAFLGRL